MKNPQRNGWFRATPKYGNPHIHGVLSCVHIAGFGNWRLSNFQGVLYKGQESVGRKLPSSAHTYRCISDQKATIAPCLRIGIQICSHVMCWSWLENWAMWAWVKHGHSEQNACSSFTFVYHKCHKRTNTWISTHEK